MKKLSVLLVALLSVTLVVEDAHAKRMGGGKSFGRTHQTAPAQPDRAQAVPGQQRQAAQPAQAPSKAAAPAAGAAKKGMMGGLLGGLLAGGLIAALFAGGAFEGLQLMDILIFALLGFLIFKLVRMFRQGGAAQQPAYAGNGRAAPQPVRQPEPAPAQRAAIAAVSGNGAIPFNLPLGFDTPAFLDEACGHYRTLQEAWNRNDMASLSEYLTPELHAALSAERANLSMAPATEVLSVQAELVRADQHFGKAEVSIRFTGRYRDRLEGVEEGFIDIWHLERDYGRDDAPWHITGIEAA